MLILMQRNSELSRTRILAQTPPNVVSSLRQPVKNKNVISQVWKHELKDIQDILFRNRPNFLVFSSSFNVPKSKGQKQKNIYFRVSKEIRGFFTVESQLSNHAMQFSWSLVWQTRAWSDTLNCLLVYVLLLPSFLSSPEITMFRHMYFCSLLF